MSPGAQARELLRLARRDRERLLASLARPPASLPPYHRVRAACEHLMLLGAARIASRGAVSAAEALGQSAARVSLELALVVAPEKLPLALALERLEGQQERSLPRLLDRLGDPRDQDPEHLLALAFCALLRLLSAVGCRRKPSRLLPLAAEGADYLTVATYGEALPAEASASAGPLGASDRLAAVGGR